MKRKKMIEILESLRNHILERDAWKLFENDDGLLGKAKHEAWRKLERTSTADLKAELIETGHINA